MSRLIAVAAAALLLVGCAAAPAEDRVITFAVAGDSLTAWDNVTFPEPSGEFDPTTWTHWAISPTLQLVGGYARGFATARDVAANIIPVDADVLVVMVGTNDTGVTALTGVLADIDAMVDTAGARTVLLAAIPPDDGYAVEAAEFNVALERHAADRGWGFLDPWVDYRADGKWVAGFSGDGIHPTADAAQVAGGLIAAAIRELVG
jgi:hypothetical protein